MKKSSMSKIVLATSLAALLTACGGSSGGSSVDEGTGGGTGNGSIGTGLASNNNDQNQSISSDSESTKDQNQSIDSVDEASNVVADTQKPRILFGGKNYVRKGEVFNPLADIEILDADQNITASVSGSVDTSILGKYTLTYNAQDKAGNNADPVIREVLVVDADEPTITLKGDNPLTISQSATAKYSEDGYEASDTQDGDLTSKVKSNSSVVKRDKLGTYTIEYRVEDNVGNVVTTKRTVKVEDQTAPVITLNKVGNLFEKDVIIPVGTTYIDPGFTAVDNVNSASDITYNTEGADKVNTNEVGSYVITYTATDKAGKVATAKRTISVTGIPDTEAPKITLKGGDVTIRVGQTYNEPSWTASDNVDTNPTVTVSGNVDTSKVGIYTLTYTVMDTVGLKTSVTRRVNVEDGAGNTIAINGTTPYTVAQGSKFIDPGFSTTDVSGQDMAVVMEGSVDTSKVGDYTLTYSATDSAGNQLSATRMVKVTDQTKPVIALNGANPINLRRGETFNDPKAMVTDNWDESSEIVGSGNVDTQTLGKYTLTYSVTDANGNDADSITRDVFVLDEVKPRITLRGDNPMIVDYQGQYQESGALAYDDRDGYINISSRDDSAVDTSAIGTYDVIYKAVDSVGNEATTIRTVQVKDLKAPTITLNGDEKIMHIIKGNGFTDPKASASDNHDGDITGSIVTDSNVDTSKVGEYRVVYSATDKGGNKSEVVRSVIVVNPPYNGQNNGIEASIYPNVRNMTIAQGKTFTDPSAKINKYNINEDLTVRADTSAVDTSTVGTYLVKYEAIDMLGNVRARNNMYVTVTDQTSPELQYNGKETIRVIQNDSFIYPDVTATDINDGSIAVDRVGAVDTSKIGTYTLKYSATDANKNKSNTKTIVVYVVMPVDENAPKITLNGNKTVYLNEGEPYVEQGASAVDLIDGTVDVEVEIVGDKTLPKTPGIYTVYYKAKDIAGNRSETTRTVKVKDTTAPTLNIGDKKTMTLTIGDGYVEPGYSATDTYSNATVKVDSNVDTTTAGNYRIIYTAMDVAGNQTTDIRRVIVTNPIHGGNGVSRPSLYVTGSRYVSIPYGGTYTEKGATATDSFGVALDVQTTGDTVDTNRVGTYWKYYDAVDSYGNHTNSWYAYRRVRVYDNVAPEITITGDNPLYVTVGDTLNDPGATATDNADGDITNKIQTTPRVNTNKAGTYTITYTARDSHYNYAETKVRTVFVVLPKDITDPVVTLVGGDVVMNEDTTYSDAGATALDDRDGVLSVITSGHVDTSTPGTYYIKYEATDLAGHTGYVYRTVTVKDITPPTIHLKGYPKEEVLIDHPYYDAGARQYDNSYPFSRHLYADGYVNTHVAGTYTLKYNYTDYAGNKATTVTRTVVVKDPTQ